MAENVPSNTTPPNRMPPQNIEAEMSLLGSLMLDKDAIIRVVDLLEPRDFYKPAHREIYEVIHELFETGSPIDLLAVSSRLQEKEKLEKVGGHAYLTELINTVPTASHADSYAKLVQSKRILRDLISISQEIERMGYNEEENTDVLLDKAEASIFAIAQKSLAQNFTNVKEALEEAFERIEMLSRSDITTRGVSTGFKDLDSILSGFQNSDLVVLAARPSMGKSGLATDIARRVALNHKVPVGIFSLEMSRDQVVDRLISAQAGVDLWKLRTGKLSHQGADSDFERIQQALGVLSEAPIFIDDTAGINVLQMRAMARRLQANRGLGLLVVDYLQLISPRNSETSMVQQVTEISRELKVLARELNIPILALSQLSRAVEQRFPPRPRLSDLRESGCLTGDAVITRADTGERIPIRLLAERQVQEPIPVFAVNDRYRVEPHTMGKAFFSGRKMVYELRTRSGRSIKASANHPFLRVDGWKRLDQIQAGDHVALPREVAPVRPTSPLSDDELVLLAHLLGDGCILERQPYHYTSADPQNIRTVSLAAQRLFGISGRAVRQKNWEHLYLTSPYRLARGRRHPITLWFEKLGLRRVRSYEKRIPQAVFQSDARGTALFVRHLWATDGNVSWKRIAGRKPAAAIYYASSSRVLTEQVQHLLLRLGIFSTVRESPSRKGYRAMYHVYVEGAEAQLKFLHIVGVAGERARVAPKLIKALGDIVQNTNVDIIPRSAWDSVIQPAKEGAGVSWRQVALRMEVSYSGSNMMANGIGRKRMERLGQNLEEATIRDLARSGVVWDKVVAIEKLGVQDVYDATVQGVHNFVANDIIVHNSIEQDSDVVMFIYREDRYRPDTPDQNIAEIIISKHRNGPIGGIKLYFDEKTVSFSDLGQDPSPAENAAAEPPF